MVRPGLEVFGAGKKRLFQRVLVTTLILFLFVKFGATETAFIFRVPKKQRALARLLGVHAEAFVSKGLVAFSYLKA